MSAQPRTGGGLLGFMHDDHAAPAPHVQTALDYLARIAGQLEILNADVRGEVAAVASRVVLNAANPWRDLVSPAEKTWHAVLVEVPAAAGVQAGASSTVTAPGAGAAIASFAAPTGGLYDLDVYVRRTGTDDALPANMQLQVGGANVGGPLFAPLGAAQIAGPYAFRNVPVAAGQTVAVVAPAASVAGAVYGADIVARAGGPTVFVGFDAGAGQPDQAERTVTAGRGAVITRPYTTVSVGIDTAAGVPAGGVVVTVVRYATPLTPAAWTL